MSYRHLKGWQKIGLILLVAMLSLGLLLPSFIGLWAY